MMRLNAKFMLLFLRILFLPQGFETAPGKDFFNPLARPLARAGFFRPHARARHWRRRRPVGNKRGMPMTEFVPQRLT